MAPGTGDESNHDAQQPEEAVHVTNVHIAAELIHPVQSPPIFADTPPVAHQTVVSLLRAHQQLPCSVVECDQLEAAQPRLLHSAF